MSQYYCHHCAARLGYLDNVRTSSLMGSIYQLDKYMKHTIPFTSYDYNSVFNDPTTQAYGDYIVNAKSAGCVEIDDRGRQNIVYYAGKEVGVLLINGKPTISEDTIKVVCSTNPQKIHAYPIEDSTISTGICEDCHDLLLK
jgi:hypothetical protein